MKFRDEPGKVALDPPELGQHMDANLQNAGYGDAEIAAMKEKAVF